MALEFSDIVIKIKKILNKSNIKVGECIAIKEDLDSLEKILNSVHSVLQENTEKLQDCVNANMERMDEDRKEEAMKRNMTFMEKVKFLFKK